MKKAAHRAACGAAALFAMASLTLQTPAHALGKTGHRVTGAIASLYLGPEAAGAIKEILGRESLAEASTWPDEMRSNPSPFWQRTASPWHYVTVPRGKRYAEVGAPEEGDAAEALARFADVLRDEKASLEDKRLALRFAVHIIGDLHQPLHAGNGTDRGGNDVKVSWYGERTNLHSVWDSKLIDAMQLSYSELAAWLNQDIEAQELRDWAVADPKVWIAESAALRDGVYPDGAGGDEIPYLSWDYIYQHTPTMERRLQQGGIRMAAWLNAVFAAEER